MRTVIQFLYSLDDGGAETLVKNYALELYKRDCNVIVLVVYPNKNTSNYKALADKIQIISVYRKHNLFYRLVNRLMGSFYIKKRINHIFKSTKPKAIHVHSALLKYLYLNERIINKSTLLFYTCHSLPSRYFGKENGNELFAARQLIRYNNFMALALHNSMFEELKGLFGEKHCLLMYNAIDLGKYITPLTVDEKNDYLTSLGIPRDSFIIGHIGRFVDVKNHLFLIDVFSEFQRMNGHAYLLMVGDGPDKEKVLDYAIEKGVTKYTVLSSRTDVNKLLHLFDAFVFPSKYEGFPLTLIEAQASNVPCYVSDSITGECKITPSFYFLSLSESPFSWANKVFINSVCEKGFRKYNYQAFAKFDVKYTCDTLLHLYFGGAYSEK